MTDTKEGISSTSSSSSYQKTSTGQQRENAPSCWPRLWGKLPSAQLTVWFGERWWNFGTRDKTSFYDNSPPSHHDVCVPTYVRRHRAYLPGMRGEEKARAFITPRKLFEIFAIRIIEFWMDRSFVRSSAGRPGSWAELRLTLWYDIWESAFFWRGQMGIERGQNMFLPPQLIDISVCYYWKCLACTRSKWWLARPRQSRVQWVRNES